MVAKTDISQSRFKNRSFAFADVNGLINSLKSSKQGGLEYGNAGTHAKMTINAGYYRFAPIENRKLKIENRSYDAWGKQTVENWMKLELSQIVGIASLFHFDKSANGFEWFMQSMNNGAGELVQGFIGKSFAHMQNIGGHIDKVGYYKGRTTIRLNDGHIGKNLFGGISFGHYVFGRNMALNPNDHSQGPEGIHLFAHEFGHTYQSRIAGPYTYSNMVFLARLVAIVRKLTLIEEEHTICHIIMDGHKVQIEQNGGKWGSLLFCGLSCGVGIFKNIDR